MPTNYKEIAFEKAIEHHLLTVAGYTRADPDMFDRDHAIDPTILIPFIQETQPMEWEYLKNLQKDKAEQTLIDDLSKSLDAEHEGCLRENVYKNAMPYCEHEEQRSIVSSLDRETACIDNLNQKIRDSIDKLREYRTALISAAVTGKIDVRKEAA